MRRHLSLVRALMAVAAMTMLSSCSGSDAQDAPGCAGLVNVSDSASFTQFEAKAPADWDVTFAMLRNPCEGEVTLTSAQIDEASATTARTLSIHATVPPPEQVFAAKLAAGPESGSALPVVVPAGATVQIVGRVRLESAAEAVTVPPVSLTARVDGAESRLELAPRLQLCECGPTATPTTSS